MALGMVKYHNKWGLFMKTVEYQELLKQISPLDTATLTRLEADLARLLRQRQAQKTGESCSINDLVALAGRSLEGLDETAYWAEREKELEDSRDSWAAGKRDIWSAPVVNWVKRLNGRTVVVDSAP
jgi:hypothetical protein